jgi:hypothetical protein
VKSENEPALNVKNTAIPSHNPGQRRNDCGNVIRIRHLDWLDTEAWSSQLADHNGQAGGRVRVGVGYAGDKLNNIDEHGDSVSARAGGGNSRLRT